jgi:excisionase family DNA binding protein
MEKLIYTTAEVSQLLGIGLNKVYELLNQNILPHVKVGRKYLIPKQGLEKWLSSSIGDN